MAKIAAAAKATKDGTMTEAGEAASAVVATDPVTTPVVTAATPVAPVVITTEVVLVPADPVVATPEDPEEVEVAFKETVTLHPVEE